MKKLFSFALSITMMFAIFSIYPETTVSAAVKLNQTKVSIGIGEISHIEFYGAKSTPTWSCSNTDVVSMENLGSYVTIKGIKQGTAKVTATYYGKKFTCDVTVTPKHVKTSKVYINQGSVYNIRSTSSTYKNSKISGTYSFSKDIAQGSNSGNIKGVKAGSTKISFYFQSGYTTYTYTIDVVVVPKSITTPTFNQTHSSITAINEFSEISVDGKKFSQTITGLSEDKSYKVYYRNAQATGRNDKRQIKSTTVSTNSKITKTTVTKGTYPNPATNLIKESTSGIRDSVYYYTKGSNLFSVVYLDQSLHINKYDSKLKFVSSKKVSLPYPIFGGFYAAPDDNFYVATGQTNDEDKQGNRVAYCVTKYDDNWNLLDKGTITSDKSGTISPFSSGTCSMALIGDNLTLHTSRLRYKSANDGLNHQSNFTATFDTSTMNATFISSAFPFNHVSHSFQSFVRTDGDNAIFVDHGDAYPRSIYMQMLPKFTSPELDLNNSYYVESSNLDLLQIDGGIGDNYTGTNVSGVEVGLNGNLVVGNSVPHSIGVNSVKGSDSNLSRNIYLSVADKDGKNSEFKWLTKNNPNGKTSASIPRLVKVNEDKFVVMFVTSVIDKNSYTQNFSSRKLIAVTVNSSGDILGQKTYSAHFTGTSQPIYFNGNIIWYENNPLSDGSQKSFYSIKA